MFGSDIDVGAARILRDKMLTHIADIPVDRATQWCATRAIIHTVNTAANAQECAGMPRLHRLTRRRA